MESRENETITLDKALSVKNRLAGRLAQARSNVETYNCVVAGQREATVDVRAEYERMTQLQEALVTVKAAIQRANGPILEDVYRLGEAKSVMQMLGGLNTKQGPEPGFNGVTYDYASTLLKPEVLEMVRRLEGRVDDIQDRINRHNATTRIELPSAVLDLAR
jgi:hypothetical protein